MIEYADNTGRIYDQEDLKGKTVDELNAMQLHVIDEEWLR